MNRSIIIVMLTCIVVYCLPAQSIMIPVERQVPVLIKVLMFDKHVPTDTSEYRVGIIYDQTEIESNSVKNVIVSASDSSHLKLFNGIPVRFIPISVDNGAAWYRQILENDISAVMVTPVSKTVRKNLAAFCSEHRIITMSTVPDYVDEDIAYGLMDDNGRQTIVINLPVSISQGAQFSSQVLRIAKVLR
jgi:hypothetical protein